MTRTLSDEEWNAAFSRDDDSEGVKRRITNLIKRLKEYEGRAETAEAGREEAIKAAIAQDRKQADQEWSAKLVQEQEMGALARLGITDDDAILLLRHDHGRLPAPNRPTLPDYAQLLQSDESARKGKSPALLAGLGKPGTGGIPSLSDGAQEKQGLTEESVRAAFSSGKDGAAKALALAKP